MCRPHDWMRQLITSPTARRKAGVIGFDQDEPQSFIVIATTAGRQSMLILTAPELFVISVQNFTVVQSEIAGASRG